MNTNQTSDGYFEWFNYRYKLDRFDIIYGGQTLTLTDGQVQGMYLERNYDDDHMPIFLIQLALPLDVYHGITANITNTVFVVTMSKEMERNDGTISGKTPFIVNRFIPLIKDSTPFLNETDWQNTRSYASTGDGTMSTQDFKTGYTFIAVKESDLKVSRAYCNTVLSSATMLDAISAVLSMSGASNVLMSLPDNNTVYNELILLPIPVINQLQYLNNYYGLYKHGAQIFFDLDRLYILRNNAACTAYADTEPQTIVFVIYEGGTGSERGRGSYTDVLKRTGYVNSGMDQLSIENVSTVSSQVTGTNSTIINNSGDVSTASSGATGTQSTFNVITTTTHNKFIQYESALRMKEMNSVITITCENIDLSLITPNKQYQVISDSSKIATIVNKPYRLVSVCTTFIKQGGYYTDVTEIKLKISDTQ